MIATRMQAGSFRSRTRLLWLRLAVSSLALAAAACGPGHGGGTPDGPNGQGSHEQDGPPGSHSKPTATANTETSASGETKTPEPEGPEHGIVAAHNAARARHCAPPVEWSEQVADAARSWAAKLRDRGCAFEHSPGMKYGENLAYMAPAGIGSPESVVDGWYREVELYDYRASRFSFDAGHFTQVVWVSTARLGCARVECKNAEIWVCNYDPPGNVGGEFERNVLPTTCK